MPNQSDRIGDPLYDDFRNFLYVVWMFLRLPPPTRRQYAIAYSLQHGGNRRIIMAFRGVGKSWITAAYVLWLLYRNPQLKILVVSASEDRATNFTRFCLQLLAECPIVQHLYPRPDQRNSVEQFDVAPAGSDQNASVKSVGLTGQMTGFRADVIVADDIEVPKNSMTQALRDKLSKSVTEFEALLKPGGEIVYLGTPQTENSVYFVQERRGYTISIWPAQYPDEASRAKYGGRLALDIVEDLQNGATPGRTTEPTRFSDTDLLERRIGYGLAGFALQFLLLPDLSDMERHPLKLRDLLVMPLDAENAPERLIWGPTPELLMKDLPCAGLNGDAFYRPVELPNKPAYRPYRGKVMSIDPSGKGKDETSYAIVGNLLSTLFVLDAGGMKGYDEPTLVKLAELALKFDVTTVIVEENFGGGMFTALLTPILNRVFRAKGKQCGIEEVRHSTQKEARIIDTLEPVMGSHRLVFDSGLIERDLRSVVGYPSDEQESYMLFHQLTRITRDRGSLKHDDRVDALSMAVAFWTLSLARDRDREVQQEQAADLEVLFQRVISTQAFGQSGEDKNWLGLV